MQTHLNRIRRKGRHCDFYAIELQKDLLELSFTLWLAELDTSCDTIKIIARKLSEDKTKRNPLKKIDLP